MDIIPDGILPTKPPRVWSGWLFKKCKNQHSRWVKRYFRLELVKLYYSKNDTSKLRKDIDLDGCEIIDEKHKKYPFYFKIQYKDPNRRDYELYAESLLAKRGWISVLNAAIRRMDKPDIFSKSVGSSFDEINSFDETNSSYHSSMNSTTDGETSSYLDRTYDDDYNDDIAKKDDDDDEEKNDDNKNIDDDDDDGDDEDDEFEDDNDEDEEIDSKFTKIGKEQYKRKDNNNNNNIKVNLGENSSMASSFGGGQSSIHSPASSTGFEDVIEDNIAETPFTSISMKKQMIDENKEKNHKGKYLNSPSSNETYIEPHKNSQKKISNYSNNKNNIKLAKIKQKNKIDTNKDIQSNETNGDLRQVEEKLKLDLKIQEMQFSLQKEWATREATLNDEIIKLKRMLVDEDNNGIDTDNNMNDYNDRLKNTGDIMIKNNHDDSRRMNRSDIANNNNENLAENYIKKKLYNGQQQHDEKTLIKSFLQRVSPQQGKSRRLAAEYGNRVRPRPKKYGRRNNGYENPSVKNKRSRKRRTKRRPPSTSGIIVSVRRARTSDNMNIPLNTLRRARKTRRKVSYMRYKNDAPKIKGQRDALYGSKTKYFGQRLKKYDLEKTKMLANGEEQQSYPTLEYDDTYNDDNYDNNYNSNLLYTRSNILNNTNNLDVTMLIEKQSQIDQMNLDLGLSFHH